jgi:hypothetical protein
MANRYAGALPRESMSQNAALAANLALFSRSFTLGNIGAMKDAFTGLPRDVQSQLAREYDDVVASTAKSIARRKAAGVVIMDVALYHIVTALGQSAMNTVAQSANDKDGWLHGLGEGVSKEIAGYAQRTADLLAHLH